MDIRPVYAARDSRNRRIPGLCTRNGRFYGVLWADRGDGRKEMRLFPLAGENGEPVRTLISAKDTVERLRASRRENTMPQSGRKPGFDVFSAEYLAMDLTQQKPKATRSKESDALVRWRAQLTNVRSDRITTPMIEAFIETRLPHRWQRHRLRIR